MVALGPRYWEKRGGVKISIGILIDVHAKEGLPHAVQHINADDVSESTQCWTPMSSWTLGAKTV
jgi:hypothetical protein